MRTRWVITGAGGFIGQHLSRRLRERGLLVSGWSRGTGCERSLDLLDKEAVARGLKEDGPEVVVHLSAQSLPGVSWEDAAGTFTANVGGTLNLLEGMREAGGGMRLVNVSSSSIYGAMGNGERIGEEDGLEGASPYAVSKLAQDVTARLLGERWGVDVVTARPFFVIGAGKTGDVCSDFARRVVAAEVAGGGTLRVGNLEAVRDFVDVEDAVEGLALLGEKGERGGVYNVCSGTGWAIREVVDGYRGMARAALRVEVDPELVRRLDEPVKVGDPSRLEGLGWERKVGMEVSLARILGYWREMAEG